MKFGLGACALSLLLGTTATWAATPVAQPDQLAVMEYTSEGVAEIFLTPDLPADWALTPSRFHPEGAIITVPITGTFQIQDDANGLQVIGGELFAVGPALTLTMRDVEVDINHLRVGFGQNYVGTVTYGSDEPGMGWGHPIFVIETTSVQFHADGSATIDAVVRLDGRFAAGARAMDFANAMIGTVRIDLTVLKSDDILVDAPNVGDSLDPTGCPGGGPCGSSPDVFCLQLGSSLQKYGTMTVDPYNDGNTTPVTAYSMDTVSCNQGDEWAIWFANSANHPLVSQTVYRIKDGRFDQIGMAWLKHTWCAADFFSCPGATHNGNGTCDWMTIGVGDVYNAGLNAAQADLGPRSDVNAATGQYPYPYTIHWNQSGNAIFKRLQVRNIDLDPSLNPGAKYLAEGYYLTTDEAPAGFNKQYNNAMFRKVNVLNFTGGGYNLGFTGAQNTHQTALEGWVQLANDPAETGYYDPDDWKPTVRSLFATEDNAPLGKIQLAFNVTDLGGGMWAYDYTVYNYNSHRSINSVSIPLPADATSVSTEFHCPFYHSDAPSSNAPWNMTNTPGDSAVWSTDAWTSATDKTVNAIRWSTGYSFHLETSSPPDNALISLGLFRPGPGSNSLQTSVLGPAPDCNGNNVADGIDISQGGFADDVPPGGDGIPDVCQAEILFGELVASSATTLQYNINGASSGQLSVAIAGMSSENACVAAWLALDGSVIDAPMEATLADWQAAEPIIVSGTEIIPEQTYEFTVSIDGTPNAPSAVQATTLVWGDVDGDSTVTLGDALAAVLDFQNGTVSALTDIDPCGGNGVVNTGDVQRIVLIFTGVWDPYPYGTQCTVPCP
ncbi:MAG: hypothetical protein ACE5E5_07685 [Phycisphaerae bacterium]